MRARSDRSIQKKIGWDKAALDGIDGQTELFKHGET
jgi:hypothetical protein